MKKQLQTCSKCGEETLHDVGKKESHKGKSTSHHIRRTTSRCRECGTKEIVNRKTGRRIIKGYNQLSADAHKTKEDKDDL